MSLTSKVFIPIRLGVLAHSITVIPVYNDQPLNPIFVAVVDMWPLFRGRFMSCRPELGFQSSGRCRQVVAILRWLLAHD